MKITNCCFRRHYLLTALLLLLLSGQIALAQGSNPSNCNIPQGDLAAPDVPAGYSGVQRIVTINGQYVASLSTGPTSAVTGTPVPTMLNRTPPQGYDWDPCVGTVTFVFVPASDTGGTSDPNIGTDSTASGSDNASGSAVDGTGDGDTQVGPTDGNSGTGSVLDASDSGVGWVDEIDLKDDNRSLRSSRRRTLDPADFEPPSGYKRMSYPSETSNAAPPELNKLADDLMKGLDDCEVILNSSKESGDRSELEAVRCVNHHSEYQSHLLKAVNKGIGYRQSTASKNDAQARAELPEYRSLRIRTQEIRQKINALNSQRKKR